MFLFSSLLPLIANATSGADAEPPVLDVPPSTEQISHDNNLLVMLGLNEYIQQEWLLRLLAVVFTTCIAFFLYRLLRKAIQRLSAKHTMLDGIDTQLLMALRWVFWPVALLFIIQQAGVNVNGLLTVIAGVLTMIAIGLVAVWSMASNLLAAFLIVSSRLFRIGDVIQFTNVTGGDGFVGKVVDIRLLYTVLDEIRPGKPDEVLSQTRIPNNIFFQNPLRVFRDIPEHVRTPPDKNTKDAGAMEAKPGGYTGDGSDAAGAVIGQPHSPSSGKDSPALPSPSAHAGKSVSSPQTR